MIVKATDQTSDERVTVESAYRTIQPHRFAAYWLMPSFPLYKFHLYDAKTRQLKL